ncbi:MAG: hypothetical protein KBS81_03770, partial [Spirochaetales bacterium]|nr:hypothetical protein [Candidatus Physcosoma equi]
KVYSSLDGLYHLKGMATPSSSRPWTLSEAELILSRIDASSLIGVEKSLYETAVAALAAEAPRWNDGDGFRFGLDLDVYPEGYAHTNGDEFRTETSWAYAYNDRRKFLELGIEMSIEEWFYSYCSLQYTLGRYTLSGGGKSYDSATEYPYGLGATVSDNSPNYTLDDVHLIKDCRWYFQPFTINIPSASKYFAFEWPLRAFVSFGGDDWNFFVGRDRIKWGESHVGNMIVDDHVSYHNLMRFRGYTGRFTYEWDSLFLDANPREGESTDVDKVRMYLLHRLGFRPYENLSFTVSENVMYQSRELSLQMLNPGMIYHNLNNRENFNAILYVDFSYAPMCGLNLYGQFALDQATAPNEDSNQDAAWGCLLGAEYTKAIGNGVLSADIEVDCTSPAFYRRDKVDFLMFQREFSLGCSYP